MGACFKRTPCGQSSLFVCPSASRVTDEDASRGFPSGGIAFARTSNAVGMSDGVGAVAVMRVLLPQVRLTSQASALVS